MSTNTPANSDEQEERPIEELAESIASNETYGDTLRQMAANIRDAAREGRI